jgi:hypothetical protein
MGFNGTEWGLSATYHNLPLDVRTFPNYPKLMNLNWHSCRVGPQQDRKIVYHDSRIGFYLAIKTSYIYIIFIYIYKLYPKNHLSSGNWTWRMENDQNDPCRPRQSHRSSKAWVHAEHKSAMPDAARVVARVVPGLKVTFTKNSWENHHFL